MTEWLTGKVPAKPDDYNMEYVWRKEAGQIADDTFALRVQIRQRLSTLRPVLKISEICRETGLSRYHVENFLDMEIPLGNAYNVRHHELLLMWLAKHESRLLATMKGTIERRKRQAEYQRRYMQRKKGET